MRALLVNPEFPDSYWSARHALAFVRRRCLLPPLGLITVAALLPGDWECRLVDLAVEPLTDEARSEGPKTFPDRRFGIDSGPQMGMVGTVLPRNAP